MAKLLPILVLALLSTATAANGAEGPKKERLICKYAGETGSRTRGVRTCLTGSEWRELAIRQESARKKDADGGRMMDSRAAMPSTASGPR
jgi:hypothetical protein